MTYDVVIPAGGTVAGEFERVIGTNCRAFLKLPNGLALINNTVNVLRADPRIGTIHVVAEKFNVFDHGANHVVRHNPTASGARNVLLGLSQCSPLVQAVVCASDLPLIQPAHVTRFLDQVDLDADVAVGLINQKQFESRFNQAPPSTFVSLRDVGPVTLSGLFVVRPQTIMRNERTVQKFFDARKSQLGSAMLLGPDLCFRWILQKLTSTDLSTRAASLLEARIQIVPGADPELAYDIDELADYEFAMREFDDVMKGANDTSLR